MTQLDRRSMIRTSAATGLTVAVVAGLDAPASAASAPKLGLPRSLDGRPAPEFDFTRANRLPREMTGYWEKTVDVDGRRRTAKVYISPETANRAYWTVVAVPDRIDTETFLRTSGWVDTADERGEGLFVLEAGDDGWGDLASELAYVRGAMGFFQSNQYFSIFGEHYLVGYDGGATPLEAWAAENPLRVISQVHLRSSGLPRDFLDQVADLEYDGTTAPTYTTVVLPEGLDRIRRDEVVLPTWYVMPRRTARPSIRYWRGANDTDNRTRFDRNLGRVYPQRSASERWTTSYSGPISQVAVSEEEINYYNRGTTRRVVDFLTAYSRYENFFAYGNQLLRRADYDALGIEVRTMDVAGLPREYLVQVPDSAREMWGDAAPVVFVWPGNTQTDRVFIDSSQWWKVAEEEGFVLVVICEQYAASPISVSHRDSDLFFRQLREVMSSEYGVDPTRFYSTGQSAGSGVTQTLAIAKPEYFAAVASTSFGAAPDAGGQVRLDGVAYPATDALIPNYLVYGAGDLSFLEGDLWDDIDNQLDDWAAYHLAAQGVELGDVEDRAGTDSGFMDRFVTWQWQADGADVVTLQLTRNRFRSHNNIPEETPLLWEFLRHFRVTVDAAGAATRTYSPSGFRRSGDEVTLPS